MPLRAFIMGSALVSGIRGSAPAKTTELFAGVEKPTITLAYMLCAEMLQNLDVKPGREEYGYNCWYERRWTFPSFSLQIKLYRGSDGKESGETLLSYSFLANPRLVFDAKEKQVLLEGFKKFKKLWDGRRANEKETTRQEQAVEAIASFFKSEQATEG